MVARTTPTVVMKPGPPKPEDDTRWLALVIRRGLLVIVRAIEEKYEVEEKKRVA